MRSYQGKWRDKDSPRIIPALNFKAGVSEGNVFSGLFNSSDSS